MPSKDLKVRIDRLETVIGNACEWDVESIAPKIFSDGNRIRISHDFSSVLPRSEMDLIVQSAIHNIATLKDHLTAWAKNNDKDFNRVSARFEESREAKIVHDLWNDDKHGRDGRAGRSGLSPWLGDISSALKITANSENRTVVFRLASNGKPRISSKAAAAWWISADIFDGRGERVGDLYEVECDAVAVYESLLQELGADVSHKPLFGLRASE